MTLLIHAVVTVCVPPALVLIVKNFLVCIRHQRGQIGHKFDLGVVVTWIVASLGGGSSCQDHLDALFKAINSYYHPSNVGTWHTKLNDFLRRLPAAFVKRLHRERSNKKSWLTPIPENAKLKETDITRFVESKKYFYSMSFLLDFNAISSFLK